MTRPKFLLLLAAAMGLLVLANRWREALDREAEADRQQEQDARVLAIECLNECLTTAPACILARAALADAGSPDATVEGP